MAWHLSLFMSGATSFGFGQHTNEAVDGPKEATFFLTRGL